MVPGSCPTSGASPSPGPVAVLQDQTPPLEHFKEHLPAPPVRAQRRGRGAPVRRGGQRVGAGAADLSVGLAPCCRRAASAPGTKRSRPSPGPGSQLGPRQPRSPRSAGARGAQPRSRPRSPNYPRGRRSVCCCRSRINRQRAAAGPRRALRTPAPRSRGSLAPIPAGHPRAPVRSGRDARPRLRTCARTGFMGLNPYGASSEPRCGV